jgi:curved DNA-binding protein CbpA
MHAEAFEALGIAPTSDGRAIRAAFLRLARIYHPDRLVGQPDDVRIEAEKRMKDASAAYELLRAANKGVSKTQPMPDDKEIRERAREYREAKALKQREEEKQRAKWMRWEAIERASRERVEMEARVAAMVEEAERSGFSDQTDKVVAPRTAPAVKKEVRSMPAKTTSSLRDRIEAAKGKEEFSLIARAQEA